VKPFELHVPSTADVRVKDKLVIESLTYYVKKFMDCTVAMQPFLHLHGLD
jgi:hypothetical protein